MGNLLINGKCVPASELTGTTIFQSLQATINDATALIKNAVANTMAATFTLISSVFLDFMMSPQRHPELRALKFSDFYTASIKRGWSERLTRMASLRQGGCSLQHVLSARLYKTDSKKSAPLAALPRATSGVATRTFILSQLCEPALVDGRVINIDSARVFPPSPCASLSPGTDSRQGLFLLLQGYALIMAVTASMAAFFLVNGQLL